VHLLSFCFFFDTGPTAIRKYKKVLLRRVDWKAIEPSEVDQATGDVPDRSANRCDLVWEGTVLKRAFKEFRGYRCPSDSVAKARLAQQGVAHYWTAARTFKPSEAIEAVFDR
jgi:U4/U6 small nuclear ribonucleoprotein PRP3